jgi:hypothetical protein
MNRIPNTSFLQSNFSMSVFGVAEHFEQISGTLSQMAIRKQPRHLIGSVAP